VSTLCIERNVPHYILDKFGVIVVKCGFHKGELLNIGIPNAMLRTWRFITVLRKSVWNVIGLTKENENIVKLKHT
jgi:hypothetical protein